MTWSHPHAVARRALVGDWIVMIVLGTILVTFFRLQVLGTHEFAIQSEQNRLRPVTIPAPRGLIVDRNGNVLADNIPGFTISLLGASRDSLLATLQRMAGIVGLDSARIQGILQSDRRNAEDQVVVRRDAPFTMVSALEERREAFPGLVIQSEPKRQYPYGGLVAHIVGYVNEITEPELRRGTIEGARFGALVGRTGIEREYDHRLRGIDGRRLLEVDALGRTVREIGIVPGSEARPGETIRTTIDVELQDFVERSFPVNGSGAVLAMDPRTGDILAMYSAPSFDPNLFVGGVDPAVWRAIRTAANNPMFNRALQGRYPPASPWKLAVASMALKRGIVTMQSHMPTPCHGGMVYGNRYFRCWRAKGHGDITLAEAIQHSCDVYFYQLGLQVGLENLLADGVQYGFNQPTGVDLPSEATSLFPASRAYFDQEYGPRGWTSGVTLNLAIGQGENSQTLLNMVRFYAMLANDTGRAPRPRMTLDRPVDRTGVPDLGLDPAHILQLRQALVSVVDRGTAVASRIASLRIAGKTGTAQNPHGDDHGWFIAFAPADNPAIVVGAIVEYGKHGSAVAPMVTRIIARHLLGDDPVLDRPFQLRMPADSAPAPVPFVPDSVRRGGAGR